MHWALLLSLLLIGMVPALSRGDEAPPAEAPRLRRGVNLSHWYAQWGTYDEKRLAEYLTPKDVALIASMGFDHVRMTLDPITVFTATPAELDQVKLGRLRERIHRFIDAKVAVIVDLHPTDEYKADLKDPAHADAFVTNWAALAGALRDLDPEWSCFEILNEPASNVGDAWHALQWRAMQAIRAAAPHHAIIADPGAWSSYKELAEFQPYDMPNVIYTFHFYDPLLFTHQAASWANQSAQHTHGVSWPVDPSEAETVTEKSADTFLAKKDLKWGISQGDFTQAFIDRLMDEVVAWQKAHGNRPVYVGEFGCYRKASPRDAMLRWHEAVRTSIEKRGWGWAIWDYAGGFSVAIGDPHNRKPDEDVLHALGLRR